MILAMLRLCLLLMYIAVTPAMADDALRNTLQSGGYVVLIRHAITEPGIGDPPGFKLGECSTQRNLSAAGREDAKRIGEFFRNNGIPVAEVWTSRWCRCVDTATLAFGTVRQVPTLDSMFRDSETSKATKARELLTAVEKWSGRGNLVLVTHAQNILEMTGVSPSSGEMVVASPEPPNKFRVIGRLDPTR